MEKLNLVNKAKKYVESALFFDKHQKYGFMKICENMRQKFNNNAQEIQHMNNFCGGINSWHNICHTSYHESDNNKENTPDYKRYVYDVVESINESMHDDMLSYITNSFCMFNKSMFVTNDNMYVYKLRFKIDNDAPPEYMDRWAKLKKQCESGENENIVNEVKKYCKMEENKKLPYLKRCEGGLGGNDNLKNKQMRFRNGYLWEKMSLTTDNDIVIDEIYNTDTEKWSHEELNDILCAFIKVSEHNVQSDGCIRGCIEMIPHNVYRY
jgi:hypothetical protein